MGLTRLSLETGSAGFFRPARNLYEKFRVRLLRAVRGLSGQPAQRLHDESALTGSARCARAAANAART
jgi:hypothetical protein